MVDENQAEQSAAEDALRQLGHLPRLQRNEYLIQPYSGGVSRLIPEIKNQQQYMFTSTLAWDVLEAFIFARMYYTAKFYTRNSDPKPSTGMYI